MFFGGFREIWFIVLIISLWVLLFPDIDIDTSC